MSRQYPSTHGIGKAALPAVHGLKPGSRRYGQSILIPNRGKTNEGDNLDGGPGWLPRWMRIRTHEADCIQRKPAGQTRGAIRIRKARFRRNDARKSRIWHVRCCCKEEDGIRDS